MAACLQGKRGALPPGLARIAEEAEDEAGLAEMRAGGFLSAGAAAGATTADALEAEPGARRLRRMITHTAADGTVTVRELIYTAPDKARPGPERSTRPCAPASAGPSTCVCVPGADLHSPVWSAQTIHHLTASCVPCRVAVIHSHLHVTQGWRAAQVFALNSFYARDGREAALGQWGFGRRVVRGRGAAAAADGKRAGAPLGARKAKAPATTRCRKCRQVRQVACSAQQKASHLCHKRLPHCVPCLQVATTHTNRCDGWAWLAAAGQVATHMGHEYNMVDITRVPYRNTDG